MNATSIDEGRRQTEPQCERTAALLRDIFAATHDLAALAEAHGMDPAALAAWANDEQHQAVLRGLCVLADFQAQLMLSRYRQLAVSELIRQAAPAPAPGSGGADGEGRPAVSAEQSRKACVDLLRADLKPVWVPKGAAGGAVVPNDAAAADLRALRAALYGPHHFHETIAEPDRDA